MRQINPQKLVKVVPIDGTYEPSRGEFTLFCFPAALTFKCLGDQWPVYCRVIREKNLCQDMRWYQRCCETCRDFYAQKLQQKS